MNALSVFKSPEGKRAILSVYDSLLEKWPVPPETRSVGTRHGEAFVIAAGERSLPPLILLHGSSSNSAMWIGDIAEYSKHFRVYAAGLPGEPGRSADIRPDLNGSDYSDWLLDMLDGLGVSKASLLGISLGGWLAVKFASAYPERVERLALLCPSGIGPQKADVPFYSLLYKPFGKQGEIRFIRKLMGTAQMDDGTIEYCRLIGKHFSPYMGTVPVFSDEELRRISCPVLLIAGDKDIMINSKKTTERARQILPRAELVLLPGEGHGPLRFNFPFSDSY